MSLIPNIAGVRYVYSSGTSSNPLLTIQTDIQRLGQAIAWMVILENDSTFSSGDYEGEDAGYLGTTPVLSLRRVAHGVIPVPSEKANPTGSLDLTTSVSGAWYLMAHVYENVNQEDPVICHYEYMPGGPAGYVFSFYTPPGGMFSSCLWMPSADHVVSSGLTLRNNVTSQSRMSGDEPASLEGHHGRIQSGWQHTGTARNGSATYVTIRPMRSQLPRRRFWYRRDRAMAGNLPLSQGVQVE